MPHQIEQIAEYNGLNYTSSEIRKNARYLEEEKPERIVSLPDGSGSL